MNVADLNNPALWNGYLGFSPINPAPQYELLDADSRWYFNNYTGSGGGTPNQVVILSGVPETLDSDVLIQWEALTPPIEDQPVELKIDTDNGGYEVLATITNGGATSGEVLLAAGSSIYAFAVNAILFDSMYSPCVVALRFITPAEAAEDIVNCNCDTPVENKTLAALRQDLMTAAGFIEQLAQVTGLTLAQMRTYLAIQTGSATTAANLPPGVGDLLDSFTNDAQQIIYRTYGYGTYGAAAPPLLVADGDLLTLDNQAVKLYAKALALSYYGRDSAKMAMKMATDYMDDLVLRSPPNLERQLTQWLQDAQKFIYRKYPALRTRHFFKWDLQEGVRFYGILNNSEAAAQQTRPTVTISVADPGVITVDDLIAPLNGSLVGFTVGDDERLPAPLTAGTRYYVVARDNNTFQISLTRGGDPIEITSEGEGTITLLGYPAPGCLLDLDPYKNIDGAWLVDSNGAWFPLVFGIPPSFYTAESQPGFPTRIEIRSCVEIFPSPQSSDYDLYIKGHFGLQPFELDHDRPTVDGHLVYLHALETTLTYYKKQGVAKVQKEWREYLGGLVAGTHTGKRYVPGTTPLPPALMPVMQPLPGE